MSFWAIKVEVVEPLTTDNSTRNFRKMEVMNGSCTCRQRLSKTPPSVISLMRRPIRILPVHWRYQRHLTPPSSTDTRMHLKLPASPSSMKWDLSAFYLRLRIWLMHQSPRKRIPRLLSRSTELKSITPVMVYLHSPDCWSTWEKVDLGQPKNSD